MLVRCVGSKTRILFGLQQMKYNLKHSRKCSVDPRDNIICDLNTRSKCELPSPDKVTVVGGGQVGMACAFCILAQNVSREVCLIDMNAKKVQGEMMDFQHGSCFMENVKVTCSDNFCASADSRVCVIAAGVRQKKGETRLDLVQRNADAMKAIIPPLVKSSPGTILLMVTNPVDVMTYVAWKLSGLPKSRVIGTGTALDTIRFRYEISTRLKLAPTSCYAWIIGEHGDSSVPVWSNVSTAGVLLKELNPKVGGKNDMEDWNKCHEEVVKSGAYVRSLKGYTSWAIGLTTAFITRGILSTHDQTIPVTTSMKGLYGVDEDIFLSLPCIVGANGISGIISQKLTEAELGKLKASAKILGEVQNKVKLDTDCDSREELAEINRK